MTDLSNCSLQPEDTEKNYLTFESIIIFCSTIGVAIEVKIFDPFY